MIFKPSLADLDLVAAESRRLLPFRVLAALVLIGLIGPALGWPHTLAWGAAILSVEALTWVVTRPHGEGRTPTHSERRRYLVAAIAGNTTWMGLSLLFWLNPTSGSAFIALLIWSALLLNSVSYAFRSATALLVFALPTVAGMVVIPALFPRWDGPQQILTMVGLLLCSGYALVSAWRNVRAADALARSQAELDAERLRAEQANNAKSAFLAFMSHEIRTPLNGVLGMVQAMERDELSEAQRDRLAVVSSSGETLLLLLNDLLDLSRIEAGRLDLEEGVVDLAAVAEEARTAFHALAADKGVQLVADISEGSLGVWSGDPTRIRQILLNLVGNAVKFTDHGEIRIAVAAEAKGVAITVSDTGAGIAPDRLLALFDRFVQADAATNRQYGGSGLGLSICRQLAELMGGSISAQSCLGEGSRFIVRLPLVRTQAPVETAATALPGEADGPPLRILAAEDNATNRLVLETLLTQVGLTPTLVHNGREAVQACEAADWDLILMDVQMPVMDGPAATRAIRAAEQASGRTRTPIVALTANAMAHHRAEYLVAGMDAMVPKPIQLTQLLTIIDQVLSTERDRAAA